MGRIHTGRRGRSGSKRPTRKGGAPSWQGLDRDEIVETIVKLARDGKTGAYIGLVLRDRYAVPSVRQATGKPLQAILEENGLRSEIPEDLQNLMKHALRLREHVRENPKDLHNGRGLHLMESRIRRLARYYREKGRLPPDWTYSLQTAELMVE